MRVISQRYHAFISYSHAADGRLAPALRDALHTFARPWNQLRALNVFLDDANLSVNPGLWTAVARALAQSEHFILMASPQAARSPWVAKEIEFWLRERSPDRLLIVLTAGDIVWDPKARDFDWSSSTALPPRLRQTLPEEPRHVDLRWAQTASDLSLSNPAFLGAVVDIAAPLHKRSKDELIGRDLEQQRRRSIVRRRVVASLAVLAAVAIGSALIAIRQQALAERQRDEATRQRDIALSRFLAQQASHLAETGQREVPIERAAAYAIESWRRGRFVLASETAARLLTMLPVARLDTGDQGWTAAFSADGRFLASTGETVARVFDTMRGVEVARTAFDGSDPFVPLAIADGARVAAFGDPEGMVHLLRFGDGAAEHVTLGYRPRFEEGGHVHAVALTSEGRLLAVAHRDAISRVIDLTTRAEILRVAHPIGLSDGAVALSRDGRYVAMGGGANGRARIVLMDVSGRRTIARSELEGGGPVEQVAFSPDGAHLMALTVNGPALLVETGTGRVARFDAERRPHVAFSPDSRLLATGTADGTVRVLETATLKEVARIREKASTVGAAAFSHRGDRLAIGTGNAAMLVRLVDGAVISRIPQNITVTSITFSSDDRHLVIRSYDGEVRVADTAPPRLALQIEHGASVNVMVLSPDGRLVATGGRDGSARLVEVATGREIGRVVHRIDAADPYMYRGVKALAFSADGRHLATGGTDGTAIVVDTASGAVVARLDPSQPRTQQALRTSVTTLVSAVAFSPDGTLVAATRADGDGGTTIVVEIATGREIARFEEEQQTDALAFSADGRLIALSDTTRLRLRNIKDGKDLGRVELEAAVPSVLSFSADGRYLAAARGNSRDAGSVHLIAVTGGAEVARIAHRDLVAAIAFDRSGRLLATASYDGAARLFDVERRREIDRIDHDAGVQAVLFSPDGARVATGSMDGALTLSSIATGVRLVRRVHGGPIRTLAFSRDGRWVATGSADGTARLIETDTGAEVALVTHAGEVHHVAFTAGDRFLATASRDGTAAFHHVDPQRVFDLLCDRAGRNLSKAEWTEVFGEAESWRQTCRGWRNPDVK